MSFYSKKQLMEFYRLKKITLLSRCSYYNGSVLKSRGQSLSWWTWQDFVTWPRNIYEIIFEERKRERGGGRELRELHIPAVNLGITPCGLEISLKERGKGSLSVAIRSAWRFWIISRSACRIFKVNPERAPEAETWRVNIESNSQLNFNGHGFVLCGSRRVTLKHSDTRLPSGWEVSREVCDGSVTRSIMDNNYAGILIR